MNRFLVFSGDFAHPGGGFEDFISSFKSLDDVWEWSQSGQKLDAWDWFQIVDDKFDEIIITEVEDLRSKTKL